MIETLFHRLSYLTQDIPLHFVGGCIRDRLLARPCWDFDFTVPGDALAIAHQLAQETRGVFIPLDEDRNIARVIWPRSIEGHDLLFDLSHQVGESLDTDLRSRDLTLNALALPLNGTSVSWLLGDDTSLPMFTDPTGGLADLRAGIVRVIAPENLIDDPLRLLRVFRFAALYGFEITPESLALVRQYRHLLNQTAVERQLKELTDILRSRDSAHIFTLLSKSALLDEILPELRPMAAIPPNAHHHLNTFDHTLEVLRQFEAIIQRLPEDFPDDWEAIAQYLETPLTGDRTIALWLKLACLLHDIGKPATYEIMPDGRARFTAHAQVGKVMTEAIAQRLKISSLESHFLADMVDHHLRPGYLSQPEAMTRRAIYRYFRDLGIHGVGMALLGWADRLATQGPDITPAHNETMLSTCRALIRSYYQPGESGIDLPKLLNGRELMRELSLQPSPFIGELLEAIREAQAEGRVQTKDEALAYARTYSGSGRE